MLLQADISKPLPLKSDTFHCIVTSPPYYSLREYNIPSISIWGGARDCKHDLKYGSCTKCYAWQGELGREPSTELYVEHLVWALEEPMRALRQDGVMFLNLGDSYERTGNKAFIPHMVAMKMKEMGWIVKQDIIWAKAISFNSLWSGSVMPEPINGWRYERHQVPADTEEVKEYNKRLKEVADERGTSQHRIYLTDRPELMVDCPGCEQCEPNGYILRKGQWRPTCSHEYIFMVAKSKEYYCDREAVKEPTVDGDYYRNIRSIWTFEEDEEVMFERWKREYGRNMKSAISIGTGNYKGKHYAAFSTDLVEPLIKVATSEAGVCPVCGNQWARVVKSKSLERDELPPTSRAYRPNRYEGKYTEIHGTGKGERYNMTNTVDWAPTCDHDSEPVPALVYDPFMGTGTTGLVARSLGRRWVGSDVSMFYLRQAMERTMIAPIKRFEDGIDGKGTDLSGLPMFAEIET